MRWGVSTSRYFLSVKKCLMAWTKAALSQRFCFLPAKVPLSRSEEGSFDAGDILPGPSVHGDFDPFLNEGRNSKSVSSFKGHGFAVTGNGIALSPWIRTGDQEIYEIGQGQADGPSIKEKHVNFQVVDEIVLGIPDLFGRQGGLIVALKIHEVKMAFLTVEKLHFSLFEVGGFKGIHRAVGPIKHDPIDHVSEFASIERLAFPGFRELKIDDDIRFSINKDLETLSQVAGVVHKSYPFLRPIVRNPWKYREVRW